MPRKFANVAMDLPKFTDVLEETEQVIQKCFTQFQTEEVFLSFNGGKDCTVLLDVTVNVLRNMCKTRDLSKDLKVLYIRTKDPFNEIEDFVKEIEIHYGLHLVVTEGELKSALQRITENDSRLKACLMGTRRTDPYSENLKFMQNTDADWPQVLRVSPLLNWSYHQIWSYILQRRVPYCSLYDKGYTSIGSTTNTRPNQALAYIENGKVDHRPAWLLSEGSLERAGRGKIRADLTNGLKYADQNNGTDTKDGPDVNNGTDVKDSADLNNGKDSADMETNAEINNAADLTNGTNGSEVRGLNGIHKSNGNEESCKSVTTNSQ